MRKLIKSIFSSQAKPKGTAAVPPGQRVYAVGDIHGRLDLFEQLIAGINQDDSNLPQAETTLILLGDLVDRGPDSAGVVALAMELQKSSNMRVLAGNHEEMFLRAFKSSEVLRSFLRHGGRETLLSYGYDRQELVEDDFDEVQKKIAKLVPASDRNFLQSCEEQVTIGDYLFVHAGIAPGVAHDQQKRSDLLWIREPFLSSEDSHGAVVVHGHTIIKEPEDRGNRIGIDTGAYYSGRLTALALEGTQRRYIEAREGADAVTLSGVTQS